MTTVFVRQGHCPRDAKLLVSLPPLVSLVEDDEGGYRLAVELHAQLPGVDRAQTQRIMDEAHRTCPYSKALRGDTSIELVVD